ncbi:MAG: multicopper oxidase domain-containing protein [Ilumatobacteraceae bacterium]
MSGNEPTGARRRRKTRVAVWLGVAGVCATGASLVPLGGHTQAAPGDRLTEGMLCSNGNVDATTGHRVFKLTADDGYNSEPDGNAIYDWGYGNGDASGAFQLPGPVLCAHQDETIDVVLTNNLPIKTSIQFPGQSGVTANGAAVAPQADGTGALVSLVQEAGASGGSITYSFKAGAAGTYLYESGSDPQLQVQMGLFGALIVRPNITVGPADLLTIPYEDGTAAQKTNQDAGMTLADATAYLAHHTAGCAYASVTSPGTCDPSAIYDATVGDNNEVRGENILLLSEVDPAIHNFMEQNKVAPYDKLNWNSYTGGYAAHYFMINGRSMPDTLAPNNAPWLPSQPYGAMAHVQPWDLKTNPLDVMLRYLAVGQAGYDFHPHSNHEHVIAEDGSLLKATNGDDNTEGKFNIMVGPGATVDATFRWTNEEGYADTTGHRVPVSWPQGLNLKEGDFWSGSPYLGNSGTLNPGILTKTECGEYYHVAHNHDLTQVTNYGITFGGMLTLIKVEPPKEVQGHKVGDFFVPTCD